MTFDPDASRLKWKTMTRAVLTIVGALLALTGGVWSLQGLNLIGGSFMSGQTEWLVIGLICLVVGIGLIALARRQPKS